MLTGFTCSEKRLQGYFPPVQKKKVIFMGKGQILTFFIKAQYFHWEKKEISTEKPLYLLPVIF